MFNFSDGYSSAERPVIAGVTGTIAAAHPLAVSAGQRAFMLGGTAADAMIAAQAVLSVVAPDACGLGGDMLALVHAPGGEVTAVNGTGKAPMAYAGQPLEGANSITVPGLVSAWAATHARFGRVAMAELLAPAIVLAEGGFHVSSNLGEALQVQRDRLIAGGAEAAGWPLFDQPAGAWVRLPQLGALLRRIAEEGEAAFYEGAVPEAVEHAVRALGGCLTASDFVTHETDVRAPNASDWAGCRLHTQPPATQGILLNMSMQALEAAAPGTGVAADHAGIELTEAAFAYRARAAEGEGLMAEELTYDPKRALLRGGPRAYLHTAGVACADAEGMVVSSLVSVFDDFGSAVYVPEGQFTLNDRAAGFGPAPNDAAPGKRPVHTLAPALLTEAATGSVWAMATPGADGQVQTLLQVLQKARVEGMDLARAVAAPRWRSENGAVLIEEGHPATEALAGLGHDVRVLPAGDTRLGAMVVAGVQGGVPLALPDWRRLTASGAV